MEAAKINTRALYHAEYDKKYFQYMLIMIRMKILPVINNSFNFQEPVSFHCFKYNLLGFAS